MAKLANKVAIITGAASGQGEAEARLFVAEGAKVVVADLNEAAGNRVAQSLGDNAVFCRLDVTDEAGWAKTVNSAKDAFGTVNVLINNAGFFEPKPFLETSVKDWDTHYRVNQLGVFLGMRAVADTMIAAGGGSIVNTSSGAGVRGMPDMFAYSSSKWGLRGMSKAAALDLAKHNIRVNCVLPGIIDTPMWRSNGPETCAAQEKIIPIGRAGTAENVAELMAFIVSDAATYFVGAEFAIDGGIVA